MVFQNKPNVAQYFVICFIFMLPFMLPFLFCSNASAIEIQQSMINIKSIDHTFYPSNTNLSNNLNNNFASTLYFAPTHGQIQSMRSLVMNLYSPTEFSKTNKFKFKIYFKISFKDSASFTMALPNCPPGSDGFRIYECDIEQLDQTTILQQLNQYPGPGTGSYLYYWSAITETDVYYVMNLKGYYNNDNLVSRNEIKTQGSFFLVKNTDSALTSDVTVDMFFTPVIVFIDELNPSDEAAQKELESTTNIENQTPQNASGGSSENQLIVITIQTCQSRTTGNIQRSQLIV